MNEDDKEQFLKDLDELRETARDMVFNRTASKGIDEKRWTAVLYHLNTAIYIVEKQ